MALCGAFTAGMLLIICEAMHMATCGAEQAGRKAAASHTYVAAGYTTLHVPACAAHKLAWHAVACATPLTGCHHDTSNAVCI